ncbi:MAG: hypothetical protein PVJ57_20890 [Phycisphaerae bacterium]|jgi:HlyD family secretion protein
MRKWIILFVIVGVIVGGWLYFRNYYRYVPVWYQPKFGLVSQGDIRVPISAAGLIEPNQRIEVKSKASGEVIERPVDEGKYVHQGDVLLVLKKDDEQRRFDGAQAELDRAKALHAQALIAIERAEANIIVADAEVAQLTARCESSEYDLNKAKGAPAGAYSPQELLNLRVQNDVNLAQKQAAEARATIARNALGEARESVKLQDAAVRVATTNLGDAQERLSETTILAKYDALVTDVRVKISEVILSGTTSLTGGTVVMYLADVSKKKVIARVDESNYGRILRVSPIDSLPETPGLREAALASAAEMTERSGKVQLTVDAFPEDTFEGVIERVEPQGKLNQGAAIIQYDVHVEITDPRVAELPLGAQAQVEFTVESANNVLRVPAEAVQTYQAQRGVWLDVPPEPGSNEQWGRKFIPCRFGITDGEFTQVVEVLGDTPLNKGAKIYTKLPREPNEDD